MSPRLLIALVAALLLTALGLLWYTLDDTPPGPRDAALTGPAGDGAEISTREPGESALAPAHPAAPVTEATEPEREAVALAETESGGFAIPDDALWVDGRVIFPDGTPLDEVLVLEASGRRFGEDRKSPRKYTVHVERDGRFRAAFGAKTRKGFLTLQGRYLYLNGKHTVDLKRQDGAVTLEPRLGGVIAGTILSPPGEDASSEIHESVMLSAQSWGSSSSRVRRSAKPSLDGTFELSALPPAAEYHIDLSSTVFADLWKEGVVVRAGEITEVEFTLARGVRIAGRVAGEDGVGVVGVVVGMENLVVTAQRHSTTHSENLTGEDGAFEFSGLQPGEVTLRVRAEGRAERVEELGRLEPGEVREDLLIVVSAGHELGGRVLWPDGTPAAGAAVSAQHVPGKGDDSWNAREFTARADTDGNFRLTGLGDRPLVVIASARRELPIRDEGAGAGGDSKKPRRPKGPFWRGEAKDVVPGSEGVIVILAPGSTLRGRVTDDTGAPVTSFRVTATPRSVGGDQESFDWKDQISRNGRDENGEFELTGLGAGVWRVQASGKGLVDSEPEHVTMPTEVPLELRAVRAARLIGVVQDPGGRPVPGAEIELTLQESRWESINSYSSVTTPDGRFEVPNATPGSLTLTATAPGWAPSEALQLEVNPGEERDGLILVVRPGARLTGEIHPSAAPVAGREIDVYGRGGLSHWQETFSDEAGRFSFEGLPGGEFTVRLEPPFGDDSGEDWRLRDAKRHEVVVTLSAGGSAHVVLGESSGGSIVVHGRVTVGGQALSGLVVQCQQDDFRTAASCDEFGNYELRVKSPGQHSFSISSKDNSRAHFSRSIGEKTSQRVDFDLPVTSISGILLGPGGQPVGETSVTLELVDEKDGRGRMTAANNSLADGTFRFGFLSPGRYRLRAGGPDWRGQNAQFAVTVTDDVVVKEGQVLDDLVIELGPGGTLMGVVTRTGGAPVERLWITVKDGAGRLVVETGVECSAADGSYVLPGLPAGTFTVSGKTPEGESAAVTVKVSVGALSRADLVISE